MVASTPAHVTAQNKGTAPACIGVGRSPWLLLGEPGRKGNWGEPPAEQQSVLCGLIGGEKGAKSGKKKLGPAW